MSQWIETMRSPRVLALAGVGGVAILSVWWQRSRRPVADPAAEERERRDYLASAGRIVDGEITDAHYPLIGDQTAPDVLVYRYRIAGVTYECAQDVAPLREQVERVRTDLPIQVRFDPRNPGDSIVVAEGWTGLREDTEEERDRLAAGRRAQTLTVR